MTVVPWDAFESPKEDESAQRRRRLEGIGVPGRSIAALESGTFFETQATAVVRTWLTSTAGFLVLSGTVGSGKSVAAAWALENNVRSEALRVVGYEPIPRVRRLSGRWVFAGDLVEASDFDAEFWKGLRASDLLVIDEATSDRLDSKGRALANFSGLLRARYDNARRTIVTTNLPPAEWLRLYGEADGGRLRDRLRDRLREAETFFGRTPLVAITGASLRGRSAEDAPNTPRNP
jgi:DNA replication protein DnaC